MNADHHGDGQSCRVVDAFPAHAASEAFSSPKVDQVLLARSQHMDVVRTSLPADTELPGQIARDQTVLVCVEGRLRMQLKGETYEVCAGQLLVLPAGVPYSLAGVNAATVLLMIPRTAQTPDEEVDEASQESFPASDAPAWTGVTRP